VGALGWACGERPAASRLRGRSGGWEALLDGAGGATRRRVGAVRTAEPLQGTLDGLERLLVAGAAADGAEQDGAVRPLRGRARQKCRSARLRTDAKVARQVGQPLRGRRGDVQIRHVAHVPQRLRVWHPGVVVKEGV